MKSVIAKHWAWPVKSGTNHGETHGDKPKEMQQPIQVSYY
jgi:hypothetical protein